MLVITMAAKMSELNVDVRRVGNVRELELLEFPLLFPLFPLELEPEFPPFEPVEYCALMISAACSAKPYVGAIMCAAHSIGNTDESMTRTLSKEKREVEN